jgi:putative ABC transport system ATP-binding protein
MIAVRVDVTKDCLARTRVPALPGVSLEVGEAIISLMLGIDRRAATTFVFSTQDPGVIAYAHRVVRLADGRVVPGAP